MGYFEFCILYSPQNRPPSHRQGNPLHLHHHKWILPTCKVYELKKKFVAADENLLAGVALNSLFCKLGITLEPCFS